MKTNNLIYIFSFILLFASCSQEDLVKGNDNDVVAKIRLELTDMQLPAVTKAVSTDENRINDLWLYMFNQ